MNQANHDRLKGAAQNGDIDSLYKLVEEDPHVLEHIDSIPFVETPLHFAVSAGHIQFVTEIMRLKPSFGWKLNPQGFTPIHLALQHGYNKIVLRLVDINKDLIRAKGREGLTPLHFVSQIGECDLLAKFLFVCPDSIGDVTVTNETALHIAVRHEHLESLQVLVGWLMKNSGKGALQLEKAMLNWEDEEGNTILHTSVRQNNILMVQLLAKTGVDLKAKNFEGRTALEMATKEEMRSILVGARVKFSVIDKPTIADLLKSKITLIDKIFTFVLRITRDITEDQRNAYLIIATLVITTTYQFALSPPGGVYQANAGDNNANTTTLNSTTIVNSTTTANHGDNVGKSVLSISNFSCLSTINFLSFLFSALTILILTPSGMLAGIVLLPTGWLTISYIASMHVISPTPVLESVDIGLIFLFLIIVMLFIYKYVTTRGTYSVGRWANKW